jgi:hypothetical protein
MKEETGPGRRRQDQGVGDRNREEETGTDRRRLGQKVGD